MLLVSLHGDNPLPTRLAGRGIPIVVGGRPLRGSAVHFVDIDNRGGARAAVAHLAGLGRRVIATIAGPTDMGAGVDRLAGYRDGLEEAGTSAGRDLESVADFGHDGGLRAMRELLARRPDIDAVFAASDLMAAGALQALREAGRRIPDDVAVVGFDDSPLAATTSRPSAACASRSRRWAAKWSGCSSSRWSDPIRCPATSCSGPSSCGGHQARGGEAT